MKDDDEKGKRYGRLQITPRPLEANHVIDLPKQLLALSIGHFRDGSPLTVAYKYYSKKGFMYKLGDAIASVVESIPKGGILIFVPSYSFLKKCTDAWNPTSRSRHWSDEVLEDDLGRTIWDRLTESKTRVILEPNSGGQEMFEEKRNEYVQRIKGRGSCVLLAVFRGKMSEGVSFNDDNARGVICVGLPYPNARDRSVEAKRAYNDEQRRLRGRTNLLPGMEWYSQQAYRALAQALGRCIRHAADYGAVIMMDSRHCDTGGARVNGVSPAHRNLPKWMRHHMRNLVSSSGYANYQGTNVVCGGWPGLATEMARFFAEAPIHAASVLAKQQDSLKAAKERAEKQGSSNHYFDGRSGKWCPRVIITPQTADPCTPNIKKPDDLKSTDDDGAGSATGPVIISASPAAMKTPEAN
uniref:ATP-dependent helicase C-terminal domain-containing protein n=1 Tax=Leptocylindrus danicus TaxID=163516 RepID=A0A7S2L9Q4_9STRA